MSLMTEQHLADPDFVHITTTSSDGSSFQQHHVKPGFAIGQPCNEQSILQDQGIVRQKLTHNLWELFWAADRVRVSNK